MSNLDCCGQVCLYRWIAPRFSAMERIVLASPLPLCLRTAPVCA